MIRALFLASPTQFAAAVLDGWIQAGNGVAGVWCSGGGSTGPNRAGLSGKLFPRSDFHGLLSRHGIEKEHITQLTDWSERIEETRALKPDVIISTMFMKRIPVGVLDAFPGRVFNLHPALLPHYRGPAPILGMLEDGTADQYGGVTLHLVSEGFDEGPIVARQPCPRSLARDEFEWRLQIADAAASLASVKIPAYMRGERDAEPQPAGSGSYRKLASHEAHLGPFLTLAALESRLRNFGAHHVHRWVSDSGRTTAVTGLSAVLGGHAHQPDRRGLFEIDVDLADCRVRLRRRTAVFQISRNIARIMALLRASHRSAWFL